MGTLGSRHNCSKLTAGRNPCQGYPSAEFDVDTLYYQWVPFFLFFQVRGTIECYEIHRKSSAYRGLL